MNGKIVETRLAGRTCQATFSSSSVLRCLRGAVRAVAEDRVLQSSGFGQLLFPVCSLCHGRCCREPRFAPVARVVHLHFA
jgi:hypothetical protein